MSYYKNESFQEKTKELMFDQHTAFRRQEQPLSARGLIILKIRLDLPLCLLSCFNTKDFGSNQWRTILNPLVFGLNIFCFHTKISLDKLNQRHV